MPYIREALLCFSGARLRLQSAEREPLPTTVASASPVCYNLFCEEGTFTITVLSFDAVFGLAAVLNQRRISGLGAAAGVW